VKLKYAETLSSFTFNFSSRRYTQATWRVGSKCIAVYKRGNEWVFTDKPMPAEVPAAA